MEDNPADVRLLEVACQEYGIPVDVRVFSDGEPALEYIQRTESPLPDILVVDINLPRVSGCDVIRAVRSSAVWATVPVAVLTTSRSPLDRAEAEAAGATCVLNKPNDYDEFCALILSLVTQYCGIGDAA